MGFKLNPIAVISKAFIRIIEVIFRNISTCKSSCCQSECATHSKRRSSSSSAVEEDLFYYTKDGPKVACV